MSPEKKQEIKSIFSSLAIGGLTTAFVCWFAVYQFVPYTLNELDEQRLHELRLYKTCRYGMVKNGRYADPVTKACGINVSEGTAVPQTCEPIIALPEFYPIRHCWHENQE